MDRTSDYEAECVRCWQQLGAHGKPGFWSPSGSLLPQLTDRSEFTQAAFALHGHIWEAKAFVKENRRDFVERGRLTARDRAQLESEILQVLRRCEVALKRLQSSLQGIKGGRASGLSACAVAHLHGMALVLTVALRGAVTAYDAMRTIAETTHAAQPSASAAAHRLVSARLSASPAVATARLPTAATPPLPNAARPGQLSGSELLRRGLNWSGGGAALKGVAKALRPLASGETPPLVVPETPPLAGHGGADEVEPESEQQQAQAQLTQSQLAVMEVLSKRFEQARAIERQMHEIAQINRSMATELTAQMEQSEKLYADAIIATDHMHSGNVQLRRTVAVKKGSGWYVFMTLVVAGLALLVLDALYPG